jgi:exonuclease SbcD
MRLLHTADWHLGRLLKGRERTPEIAQALEELKGLIRSERIEGVLVSGDLFDHPQISGEVEQIAYDFFLDLWARGIPAWVIAGNHDGREHLAALAPLFALAGITMRAELALKEEVDLVRAPWGSVAHLPFLSERRLIRAEHAAESQETWRGRYADGMRRILAYLAQRSGPGLGLLLAHFMVEGSRLGGGEYQFYCSNSYAVPAEALPLAFHYVALGHIHRQQQVSEAPVAWYPGSLIQLDFGEGEEAPRGALIVELEPGHPPRVHPIAARWGKPLRTWRLGAEELEGRLEELRRFPGWSRLIVEGALSPERRERMLKELPGLLDLQILAHPSSPSPVLSLRELGWEELYQTFLRQQGREASPELLAAFREAYEAQEL